MGLDSTFSDLAAFNTPEQPDPAPKEQFRPQEIPNASIHIVLVRLSGSMREVNGTDEFRFRLPQTVLTNDILSLGSVGGIPVIVLAMFAEWRLPETTAILGSI